MEDNPYAPCQLAVGEDGAWSLMLTEFDGTAATFEAMGQEGGGYGWHGVADALMRMKAPELGSKLHYDPEGSMFVAFSRDRDAVEQLARLMRSAIDDPKLLREAIRNADPELMD